MFTRCIRRKFALSLILLWAGISGMVGQGASHLLLDYDSETGDFTYLNTALGTGIFYSAGYLGGNSIVANVEAGNIWFGHDAFNRPPDTMSEFFTFDNPAIPTSPDEQDYHATMVGHVLAGTGYVLESDPEQYYLVGIGMAPEASVWSGAVATSFSETNLGEFSTTTESVITTYKAFFNGIDLTQPDGINLTQPDVINSSWGGTDPAGTAAETVAIDGLARQNATVAFVTSAGNDASAAPGTPGSGYNNITVGSVGGISLLDPSSFSSAQPADFYNPQTGETLIGVRSGVDLAAPGENFVLAANLADTGSLGASTDPDIMAIVENPSPTDLYFLDVDGTSFASPVVAGGIALLKDVAKSATYATEMGQESLDTRVVKSVLMASSQETTGWNNGQTTNEDGVIITTQSLDYATGAGALDLENAAAVYVFGTTDVVGDAGGVIATAGWDLGALAPGESNEYLFSNPFDGETELTISLNWFAERAFDNDTDLGSELSFANFDLEVWMYDAGLPTVLIAESSSLYNNSEFLRFTLNDPGTYGILVDFDGMIYDLSGGVTSETYGLAWQANAVPEPGTGVLVISAVVLLAFRRQRTRRSDQLE